MVDFRAIFAQFAIEGELVETQPFGGGHINDTYLGVFSEGEKICRVVLQRVNRRVFQAPEQVMENIERVTRHLREKIAAAGGDPLRETLSLIPARQGGWHYQGPDGHSWRCTRFIEGARTYEAAERLELAHAAAAAFGRFLTRLADLPGPRLHETIPNFHNTPRRFADFTAALETDAANRAAQVRAEIAFILEREADAARVTDRLACGELPERITHNDTKLNNVLIDDDSGQGICVIDLDTVMPGSALYDFGDLIRMGAACADEDERDLSRVGIDMRRFEALARGYLQEAGSLLVPAEWDLLAFAGRLITYEQAMRFLGDYINGDVYYKVHRPGHNLDRARTQIRLLAEMERQRDAMETVIDRLRRSAAGGAKIKPETR